ncbi:MAG: class I SAM-dependent methyltransferase, partial [Verrucomicrobia bacterium]|nr:class I SAM-dependent methyltransferase [Verrucomicrobiota bacterium]
MTSRRDFYEQRAPHRVREAERHYHTLLNRHFAFLIPPGQRVLEIGCGLGDTLAAVKPARGVGVDFSPAMVELAKARHPQLEFRVAEALDFTSAEPFDYIILSDLVNDVPDVQALLERVRAMAHPKTRLVLNFFNNLWKPILGAAESCGWKAPTLQQNWLSAGDMRNLLHLAGWEMVKQDTR